MWQPTLLPLHVDLESKTVLRKLPGAHRALAELKGIADTIPNQGILLNSLALQEAKDSSEVENIVTTHDELYKANLNLETVQAISAREVQNYIEALKRGFFLIEEYGLLTMNNIKSIQETLEKNSAGFRKVPGTTLRMESTGEVIYEPPQHPDEIENLLTNLETYINDDTVQDVDVLIKMAVIHFQFESIHPFYDGNGRTGRITNLLYLILKRYLTIPILYISGYINQHKSQYYRYLQSIREDGDWEPWLLFMIDAVEQTAKDTIDLIKQIQVLMMEFKHKIRKRYKFYSQDLLNNLFTHPYTKIDIVMEELNVSRPTASGYLKALAEGGFIEKYRMGRQNYYVNFHLVTLLSRRNFLSNPSQ